MKSTIFAGALQPASSPESPNCRGIYRLSGEGAWERLQGGLPDDLQVNVIVQHPGKRDTLYIGTQRGLFRSEDGGDSWADTGLETGDKVVFSVLFHPTDPDTIYAGMDYAAIAKTTDGGRTWRDLPTVQPEGALDACFPVRVLRMAADPSNPDEVYAAMEVGGIIRSLDGGESWQDMSAPLIELSRQTHLKSKILSDSETEGMMDLHALAISAKRPGTVWIANRMGLFVSEDRGETWREFGIGRFSDLTYGRDLMVSPHDSGVFYAALSDSSRGVAGSIYRSDDGGENWSRVDHDIDVQSTAMSVCVSRDDPERVYFAARLGQVFGTEDGGKTWQAMPMPAGVVDMRSVVCV